MKISKYLKNAIVRNLVAIVRLKSDFKDGLFFTNFLHRLRYSKNKCSTLSHYIIFILINAQQRNLFNVCIKN